MNKNIFLMISLFLFNNAIAEENKKDKDVNIHINFNPNFNLKQNQSSHHESSAINNQDNSGIKADDNFLYNLYKQQSNYCQNSIQSLYQYLQSHKIETACTLCIATYGTLLYQIYQANQIIENPESWSCWHHGKTLEDLFKIPQNELEKDLLFEIQSRYVNPYDITDFMYSLNESKKSLQEEMQTITEQITRYTWLEKCYASSLFFVTSDDIVDLHDKHKKLAFIQHLFTSWCAQYKMDKIHNKN